MQPYRGIWQVIDTTSFLTSLPEHVFATAKISCVCNSEYERSILLTANLQLWNGITDSRFLQLI